MIDGLYAKYGELAYSYTEAAKSGAKPKVEYLMDKT